MKCLTSNKKVNLLRVSAEEAVGADEEIVAQGTDAEMDRLWWEAVARPYELSDKEKERLGVDPSDMRWGYGGTASGIAYSDTVLEEWLKSRDFKAALEAANRRVSLSRLKEREGIS